jgi:hypothetical protein
MKENGLFLNKLSIGIYKNHGCIQVLDAVFITALKTLFAGKTWL